MLLSTPPNSNGKTISHEEHHCRASHSCPDQCGHRSGPSIIPTTRGARSGPVAFTTGCACTIAGTCTRKPLLAMQHIREPGGSGSFRALLDHRVTSSIAVCRMTPQINSQMGKRGFRAEPDYNLFRTRHGASQLTFSARARCLDVWETDLFPSAINR
jgi:hypothetical protein